MSLLIHPIFVFIELLLYIFVHVGRIHAPLYSAPSIREMTLAFKPSFTDIHSFPGVKEWMNYLSSKLGVLSALLLPMVGSGGGVGGTCGCRVVLRLGGKVGLVEREAVARLLGQKSKPSFSICFLLAWFLCLSVNGSEFRQGGKSRFYLLTPPPPPPPPSPRPNFNSLQSV